MSGIFKIEVVVIVFSLRKVFREVFRRFCVLESCEKVSIVSIG